MNRGGREAWVVAEDDAPRSFFIPGMDEGPLLSTPSSAPLLTLADHLRRELGCQNVALAIGEPAQLAVLVERQ